jgi:hypothetical protein
MSIIKVNRKKNPYVMLDKTCLMDIRLSWRAKGMHAYIMGLPEDWDIRVSHLVKQSTEGRDSVYSTINELKRHGYMTMEHVRTETGRYSACNYICYETPQEVSENGDDASGLTDTMPHDFGKDTGDASLPENPEVECFAQNFDDFKSLPGNPEVGNQHPEKPIAANPSLVINKSNNKQDNKLITAAIAKPEQEQKSAPIHFAAADFSQADENQKQVSSHLSQKPSQVFQPLSGIDTQIDWALGLTQNQKNHVMRCVKAQGLNEAVVTNVMQCLLDRSAYTRSGIDFQLKLNVILKQIRDNKFAYVSPAHKQSPVKALPVAQASFVPTPKPNPIAERDEILAGIAQWENMARLASDDTKQSLNKMIENARAALSRFKAFSSHTFSPTT